jgi:hypothetical protein
MDARVAAFVSRRWGVPTSSFRVDLQPLRGGLESSVARARIVAGARHEWIPARMVIKQLPAGFEREVDVYGLLWEHFEPPPAVQLLGHERAGATTYLFLEDGEPAATPAWPWSDTSVAAMVCRELARLHDHGARLPRTVFSWDYETELATSARATLDLARTARDDRGRRYWRRLGDLRRVVSALPDIRACLVSDERTVIHGDVHPGNLLLRRGHPAARVALIDWARARLGSPLEDVASWLHSLGCWEPEARRRHDTLMAAYLESRARPRRFSSDMRRAYWCASASNGLSGAIRYHLAVLTDSRSMAPARASSRVALAAWERAVRRAAASLCYTPSPLDRSV